MTRYLSVAVIDTKGLQKAIFFGGWVRNKGSSSKVEIYDAETDTLVEEKYSLEARWNAAAATVGAKAIFFGGIKASNDYSSKVDIYNDDIKDAEKPWREAQLSYIPEARPKAAVAVIGYKAIFFGRENGNMTYSSKIDIYDAKTGEWRVEKP